MDIFVKSIRKSLAFVFGFRPTYSTIPEEIQSSSEEDKPLLSSADFVEDIDL